MKTVLIAFSIQVLLSAYVGADIAELSAMVKLCGANDPNLNQCVKEQGQIIIPSIAKGVPQWNIPSLDPMHTESATFTQDNKDSKITIAYKNIIQTGISTVVIEDAKVDLAKGQMVFYLKYPIYTFEADYVADGELFDFRVKGNGKANITVWDSKSSVTINFHVENDRAKEDSVKVTYDFEKIFLDYSNLIVNDDPELSASAGTFINENSLEILNGFKAELEEFYSKLTSANLKGFFDSVPYSLMFPQ